MMQQVDFVQLGEMMTIQQAAKPKASFSDTVSFAQVQHAVAASAEESGADWFTNTLYQSLAHLSIDRSVVRTAVDIPPEAIQAMRLNPAYRRQVLALLHRDLGHSYYPRQVSMHVHVGKSLSDYRAQSWTAGQDEEFDAISEGCFFQTGEAKPQSAGTAGTDTGMETESGFRNYLASQVALQSYRPQPRSAAAAYQARAAYGMQAL